MSGELQSWEPCSISDARGESESIDGDLHGCTGEQLASAGRLLISALDSRSVGEILDHLVHDLSEPARVRGCAIYCTSGGLGFHLAYGRGDYASYLPDTIAHGSDLYRMIVERKCSSRTSPPSAQPSLFDDPLSIFYPTYIDNTVTGAVVAVHDPCDVRLLRMILPSITNVIELASRFDPSYWCGACARTQEHCSDSPRQASPTNGSAGKHNDEPFTTREREILPLLAAGLSNREIAEKLYISAYTCKHHVANIMAKLRVHSRAAVVSAWLSKSETEPAADDARSLP